MICTASVNQERRTPTLASRRLGHVLGDNTRVTLVFYRKRASEIDWVVTVLWRAFDKTVRRKPL